MTPHPRPHTPPRTTALPGRWIDLLRDGDTQGRHNGPHGACLAYALRSHRAGRTAIDYVTDVSDPRNALGDYYRRRDDRTARPRSITHQTRLMRKDWAKAVRYAAAHPQARTRPEAHQRLAEIRAAVDATTWTKRTGQRDRIVLLALLAVGDSLGTVSPRISTRTLSEDTPYSQPTTWKALAALESLGWVHADRSGMDRQNATVYRLTCPDSGGVPIAHQETDLPSGWSHLDKPWVPPDAGLAMALTAHAAVIHAALSDAPRSVREVVAMTGVSLNTVRRWMPKLAALGLAVRGDDWRWVVGPGVVADVVADSVAPVRASNRAARHKVDRELFHGWVEARAADVGGR